MINNQFSISAIYTRVLLGGDAIPKLLSSGCLDRRSVFEDDHHLAFNEVPVSSGSARQKHQLIEQRILLVRTGQGTGQ